MGSKKTLPFYYPTFEYLLCIFHFGNVSIGCDIVFFKKGKSVLEGLSFLIFCGFYDIRNQSLLTLGHVNINKFLGFKIWKNNVLSVNYLSPPLISTKIKIEKMDCIFTANNVIILKLKNITSQIKEKSS